MQFNPPLIRNIEEVLPHIKDNPAFIVVDKGWYKVIDYVYAHRDTFTNDFARECRGLKFDRDGNIIARPYHKFHNLNECAGYHTADVDLSALHVILDKLDGSMVHTCRDEFGKLFLMTRMGHTDVAAKAQDWLIRKGPLDTILNLVNNNPTKTFIFEYVAPHNRIVVPYEREELILTGIRDIFDGTYQTYMGMVAYAARFTDLPVVQHYPVLNGNLDAIYRDEFNEGAVVRFDTGAMVKIKADAYCRKHKSKELSESFKGVVQLIVESQLDDVLAALDEKTTERLLDYQEALLERFQTLHEGIRHNLSLRKGMEQKEFALNVQENFPRAMQTLLFMTRKSGDGYSELINLVRKRYAKDTDLADLFEQLDIPVWQI